MVIMIKTLSQFVGCVFITEIQTHACWLVQLLGIGCIKKFGNVALQAGIIDPNECTVPRQYIGLAWDGVCFGFLLFQRRIFMSYCFLHMVDDCKASAILASRGKRHLKLFKMIFIVFFFKKKRCGIDRGIKTEADERTRGTRETSFRKDQSENG